MYCMKSWYDLSKDEQKQLKNEYNEKRHDNDKIVFLNFFKIIFYLFSFMMFFLVLFLVLLKINDFNNDFCPKGSCDNNLMIYVPLFVGSLSIGILLSVLSSKIKRHFVLWLKSRNIEM